MKRLDLKGKACPLPIILTKKAISEASLGDAIEVILDNAISKCNLEAYLKESSVAFLSTTLNDEIKISFTVGSNIPITDSDDSFCDISLDIIKDYVVVFSSDEMGRGDKDLGRILVRSYLNALAELSTLPKTIIFYNSGVKLLEKDSDTAISLLNLIDKGVNVIACGVCIEYYKVTLGAGKISNMFVIGESVASASKVIYP